MHEYLFAPEVVRVALVVGVVVSIMFYERMHLTTGGAIVPAYLVLFLPEPLFVVVTLVIGYLTYLIVNRVIARRFILYGRRKFEVELLVGLALLAVSTLLGLQLQVLDPTLLALVGVGFLIPGVLAHDMFRQKPAKTLLAVVGTMAILVAIVFVFDALLKISPAGELGTPPPFDENTGYPLRLLLFGVICSVLAGMVVFAKVGVRSGGFVTAAYVALVMPRPWDLLFAAVTALVTWALVAKVIMPRLLIFGRRKLATMVLVGSVVAWGAELVVMETTGYIPWTGFILMTLMVPALLANDAHRQGVERTLWGAAISSLTVFGVMNLLSPFLDGISLRV